MNQPTNDRLLEIAALLGEMIPQKGADTEILEERLELAQRQIRALQLEDEGWQLISGGNSDFTEGVTLDQLKDMSELLRQAVAGSPLPKQANNLRSSYTFSQKFLIPGLEGTTETKRGRPDAATASKQSLQAFAAKRTTREYVLGKTAQELISSSCSTDGMYLLLGDDTNQTVHALTISEISQIMVNPDHPGEIWAYRRDWTPDPTAATPKVERRWYYTDRFEGKREDSLGEVPNKVKVDKNKTIIDLSVNNQTGWALGVPDLWAGHVWSRNYLAGIKDGMEVTSLMAWLSAKVKTQSRTGSNAAGVKIGQGGAAGSVQTYGEGNAIDTYSTTGKGYDFDNLRPLAALYALAAGVSVVDLLASPSAAGASYGSASALAPGMRRAIEVRRDAIAAWMERVLEWAVKSYHAVTPASIEEVEPYRRMQMLSLAHLSGLYHPDEVRPEMAYLANITLKHDEPPKGYMLPNNEESLPRKDVDADGKEPTKTAASPTQGKGDGTGGQGSTAANDQRTDNI